MLPPLSHSSQTNIKKVAAESSHIEDTETVGIGKLATERPTKPGKRCARQASDFVVIRLRIIGCPVLLSP
jgi:hypothetical protein